MKSDGLLTADGNALAFADAHQLVTHISSEVVDLAYLDPPRVPVTGTDSAGNPGGALGDHLDSLRLVLQQVRRALKPTGTLFVHCVPKMNGHMRVLLDEIYGRENFRHEYLLPLNSGRWTHSGHDTLLFYSVGERFVLNHVMRPLSRDELSRESWGRDTRGPYRLIPLLSPVARPEMAFEWRGFTPPEGYSWRFPMSELESLFKDKGRLRFGLNGEAHRVKQFTTEPAEVEIDSNWFDLVPTVATLERVEATAEKPVSLLDRIIRLGSSPEGVVLDPFCGSGTTLIAAQQSGRRWIGGDDSPEAIETTRKRLASVCKLVHPRDYRVYD